MRDYATISKRLRRYSENCVAYKLDADFANAVTDAADAIEELLAAESPSLWTDEPIEGTEFMTHSQGGRKGFEIHFRTDSLEKYKAVQEECRCQIGHSKPEPQKEENAHD